MERVSDLLWGCFLVFLILAVGIFLTVRLRFFQLRNFRLCLKKTVFSIGKPEKNDDKKSVSAFRAVSASLAATVGTGNITGVATAITVGGPGALFWMWVAAFFGMATKFSENLLGTYFRRKNANGEWSGGAAYYLRDGVFGGKVLSVSFAFCCMAASFGIGNAVQANNVAELSESLFGSSRITVGLLLAAVTLLCLCGGLSRVGAVTEFLVPFMALFYIGGCLYVIISNGSEIFSVLSSVFRGAFGLESAFGGGMGVAVQTGIKRGVFSNEAGLASSATVNASSSLKEPVEQGLWGIFEVFVDTFVICTLTGLVILLAKPTGEGTLLVISAFESSMGRNAAAFVSVSSILFSFSTILGWSQYGVKSCEYLFGLSAVPYYKAAFSIVTAVGASVSLSSVWAFSDICNGLTAIPNIFGLFSLSNVVVRVTENYIRRQKGEVITPDISNNFQKSRRFY